MDSHDKHHQPGAVNETCAGTRICASNGSEFLLFIGGHLLVTAENGELAGPLLSLWDVIAAIDRFEFPLVLDGLPIRRERLLAAAADLLEHDGLPGHLLLAPLAALSEVFAREGYAAAAARVRQIEQTRGSNRGA